MKLGSDRLRIRGAVVAVADGRDHVAAASDHMFAVFDASTGSCVYRELRAQFESFGAVAFSHERARVAYGKFSLRVLDLPTQQPRWTVRLAGPGAIGALRWSPCDRFVGVSYRGGGIDILDAATGTVLTRIAGAGLWAFRGDSVVWSTYRALRASSIVGGDALHLANAPESPFALAADSCVTRPHDGSAYSYVWRAYDGTELARLPTATTTLDAVAIDEVCERIAIIQRDALSIYARDRTVRSLGALEQQRWIAVALGTRRLVAGDRDGEILVIDVADGSRVAASPAAPSSLAFVGDARLACAGPTEAVLRELATGDVVAELGPYQQVAVAGRRILAWGRHGARVFDDQGSSIVDLANVPIHTGAIAFDGVVALAPAGTTDTPMVFDEHGTHLRTYGGNGNVDEYSLSSMSSWTRNDAAAIAGMCFLSPTRLYTFYENGTIEYHDEAAIQRPYIPFPEKVVQLDEHVVVGPGYHRVLRIVDGVVSSEPAFVVRNMRTFGGRGHTIAFGAEDGRIVLYDARTGQEVAARSTHLWNVRAIAIDPTCSLIASSSDDGTLIVQGLWTATSSEA